MLLNGWKEIANYLKRGVRTVQRWEHLGIPIRRPAGRTRSAVCAVSEEIDVWLKQTDVERLPDAGAKPVASFCDERLKLQRTLVEHGKVLSVLTTSVQALQQKIRAQAKLAPSRPLQPGNNPLRIADRDERLRRTG